LVNLKEEIEMIDWSEEWKKCHESFFWVRNLNSKGLSSEDFWDSYDVNDSDDPYETYAGYPGPIVDKMIELLNPGSNVLDIGAGAGAYTIPLARFAEQVTVVEPSKGQISRLMKRAHKEKLSNIRIINKRWEDVERHELDRYDLVNAAYCFHMPDIKAALQRMLEVTDKYLFLIALVDHGFGDVYERVFGDQNVGPDYSYLYNVLYQMGYKANVKILTREYLLPLDMQLKILRESYDFSSDAEARFNDYLLSTDRIIEADGQSWVKRRYKDAMIWHMMD